MKTICYKCGKNLETKEKIFNIMCDPCRNKLDPHEGRILMMFELGHLIPPTTCRVDDIANDEE